MKSEDHKYMHEILYEISVFLTNFIFFRWNEIVSWGKKHAALFQTHN